MTGVDEAELFSRGPRTVVVTGTAQGIGAAIADRFAELGEVVHRLDRDGGSGSTAIDLSDSAAVDGWFAGLDRIDVLVNCAGGVVGQVHTPVDQLSDADWQAVLSANLSTAFHCSRAAARLMKAARSGRIVTISSGAGRSVSLTGIQAYAAAKAAQLALTRQLAHELGRWQITVNAVAPGFVRSNPTTERQWHDLEADGQQRLLDQIAVRRTGEPADIVRAVEFFAARDAGWVSGQTLSVDGGSALF